MPAICNDDRRQGGDNSDAGETGQRVQQHHASLLLGCAARPLSRAVAVTAFVACQPARRTAAARGRQPSLRRRRHAGDACVRDPSDYARFDLPLRRTARAARRRQAVKIVAIGSSSTAGAGASYAGNVLSEPARRRAGARVRRPRITVLNRGVNGDDARRHAGALRQRRDRGEARSRALAGRHQFGAARQADRSRTPRCCTKGSRG